MRLVRLSVRERVPVVRDVGNPTTSESMMSDNAVVLWSAGTS